MSFRVVPCNSRVHESQTTLARYYCEYAENILEDKHWWNQARDQADFLQKAAKPYGELSCLHSGYHIPTELSKN